MIMIVTVNTKVIITIITINLIIIIMKDTDTNFYLVVANKSGTTWT
jgi:hypothetical protein